MVQTKKEKKTYYQNMSNNEEFTQEKYNEVIKLLKKEKRKVRKINRERFNNERRNAAEKAVDGPLQNNIYKLENRILELEDEYYMKRHKDKLDFKNAICKIAAYTFSVCGIWVLRELYFATSCDCE
jgi:hypothetical protein